MKLCVQFLMIYKKAFDTVNHEILFEKVNHDQIKSKKMIGSIPFLIAGNNICP